MLPAWEESPAFTDKERAALAIGEAVSLLPDPASRRSALGSARAVLGDEALRELAEVTAGQWGMVTTAQAGAVGVSLLTLSRLADEGHMERLAHGVYKDAGSSDDELVDLRAAWLSTDPKYLAEGLLRSRGGVSAGWRLTWSEAVSSPLTRRRLHRDG